MEFTKLMALLSECAQAGSPMVLYWDDGCIFKSKGSTGPYESDNSFEVEPEDESYREYYACMVGVAAVIAGAETPRGIEASGALRNGTLVEITDHDAPLKIEAEDGALLWSRDRDFGPWVRPSRDSGEE